MARIIHRLTAVAVANAKAKGLYPDGGGLYLRLTSTGTKSWILRFKRYGGTRDMGLGPLGVISLARAESSPLMPAGNGCRANVVVGIIDTGLDAKHPALKGLHFIQHPEDAQRRGDNWHGTGVAALLAGARESSTPGLIPDAQYVVVDAFFASSTEETRAGAKPDEQSRQTITDTDHLLWALEMLQQKRAEVINMRLVGPSDPAIHAEIRKMALHGMYAARASWCRWI